MKYCFELLVLWIALIVNEISTFESLDLFYIKKIDKFSKSGLELVQGDYGYELKCKRDYQPEENVMMIQWNDTISSFDSHYHSYNDIIETELLNESLSLSEIDSHLVKLIVNINYLAYIEPKPSEIKDYLKHQLSFDDYYFDYLPYWNSNLKLLLKKVSGSPIIEKDLFEYNDTGLMSALSAIKTNMNYTQHKTFLSTQHIKASVNLILSKAFVFSLKAYKIISHSSNVTQDDLDVKGYILIPGADVINHKKLASSSKNVIRTQIKYEKGNIIIKSGSTFSIGDAFTINYDTFQSLEHFMKTYGFTPIESLNDNMVFSSSFFNVSTDIVSRICYALSACVVTNEKNIIQIVQYSNMASLGKMTLHRLSNWQEEPMTIRKMIDIFEKLRLMTHLNSTEGMAMSDYGSEYYGTMLYKANFQLPIESLLSMYYQNEKGEDVGDMLNQHNIKGYQFNSSYEDYLLKKNGEERGGNKEDREKYKKNFQKKFREIIKYCLVDHHVIALNMRESIERLNKTIDNLFDELEKEIIDFFA